MQTANPGKQQRRRGTAAVELAFVAPLLIVLIAGTLELSRALQVKQILADACRSAGRLAVQPSQSTQQVVANAQAVLKHNRLDAAKAIVTLKINGAVASDLSAAQEGDDISITVSIPASTTGYVTPIFLAAGTTYSETLVLSRMRK